MFQLFDIFTSPASTPGRWKCQRGEYQNLPTPGHYSVRNIPRLYTTYSQSHGFNTFFTWTRSYTHLYSITNNACGTAFARERSWLLLRHPPCAGCRRPRILAPQAGPRLSASFRSAAWASSSPCMTGSRISRLLMTCCSSAKAPSWLACGCKTVEKEEGLGDRITPSENMRFVTA